MLILGRRALRPSCHSFTFKPSIEPLFSAKTRQERMFEPSSDTNRNVQSGQRDAPVPEMGIPPNPVLC